jgi:hypothetical protein
MERFNGQLVDLEKVFTEQHYVHPGFRGRTSIKAVLPVLRPELSYTDLAIKDGASASNEWWRMIALTTSAMEKQEIAQALRACCGRDSYAMFAIWKVLQDVAAETIVVDQGVARSA